MTHHHYPPILTIAGSDSSGGAGIQADLKTIQACGGYGMSVITALTAQNTTGVSGVMPVPPEFVRQQLDAVLSDIPHKAIKTGMLANAEIIENIAIVLSKTSSNQVPGTEYQTPMVVDPVMIAKGGASLLADDAITALKEKIIPLAALVTPNIPEAEALSGEKIQNVGDMHKAAEKIVALGSKAVLIKGGHLDSGDTVYNLLKTEGGEAELFTSPRIQTQHTHGTGCTLSAAIATYLGHGLPLKEACTKAEAYVAGAIKNAPGYGAGHGPLAHHWNIKRAE